MATIGRTATKDPFSYRQSRKSIASHFEAINYTPDGRQLNIDFKLTPIFDDNGKVALLLPEGSDITPLKKAEQRLSDNLAEQDAILNSQPSGVLKVDLDYNLLYVNKRFRDIYRLPATLACPGRHMLDIYRFMAARGDLGSGNEDQLVSDALDNLKQNIDSSYQRKLVHGRVLEVHCSHHPEQNSSILTIVDITQQNEAQEQMLRLMESSPVGAAVLRSNGDIIYSNDALASILGLDKSSLSGTKASELFEDPDELPHHYQPAVQSG